MLLYKMIQLIWQFFGFDLQNKDKNQYEENEQIELVSATNSCKLPNSSDHFSFKRIYENNEIL